MATGNALIGALACATTLFNNHPHGISESKFVELVKQNGFTENHASEAVDWLISNNLALRRGEVLRHRESNFRGYPNRRLSRKR